MCHYSVEVLTVAEPACLLFCVELLAVLALQYHPNALINSNLDLATAISYFTLSIWQKHEWKSISHSEVGHPFSSEKARSGTAGCWPAGAKDYEERPEEADTSPCCPRTFCCPACIVHVLSKGEMRGKYFTPCDFTKHLEKTQSLVQIKTWALAICFSCFLPCLAAAGTGILIQLLATKSLEATGVWICEQLLLLFHLLFYRNN